MVITLHKVAKFFLYAAVFSVTIVLSSTFFPFIGGKYYFFRLMVELALVFLFLWWAFEARAGEFEERLRKAFAHPLFIAASLFMLAYLLAVLFSVNPYGAFWSNYERGEGGFQMLHYYAFFVLLMLILDRESDWMLLFKCSLAAALLMIGYGVMAAGIRGGYIGPYVAPDGTPVAPTLWGRLNSTLRFQGSLGNPAYVAPYLLFTLFYTFYLWARRSGDGSFFAGRLRHGWYGLLTATYLLFFFWSQTRGAFLGLCAGVVAFLAYGIFAIPRFRKAAAGILAGFALVIGLLIANHSSPLLRSFSGSRMFEIAFSQDTVKTRIWTWGSAWRGFLDRPLFGWGPENFSAVFDKHFDTRHFQPGGNTETWFDRAHSIVFDYLAEIGAVGFLAFLSMFGAYYVLYIKKIFRERVGGPHPLRHHVLRGLMLAIPAAYLVQGAVLFDVLPIYLNLFLVLAFGAFQTESA